MPEWNGSISPMVNRLWDPTGTYFEPDSRTNNTTVKVGVGYAFGSGYEPLK